MKYKISTTQLFIEYAILDLFSMLNTICVQFVNEKLIISLIFLFFCDQVVYLALMVKYTFPLSTFTFTGIVDCCCWQDTLRIKCDMIYKLHFKCTRNHYQTFCNCYANEITYLHQFCRAHSPCVGVRKKWIVRIFGLNTLRQQRWLTYKFSY